MIHSFPHLIAGTDTQVAPPPASTGEPGYTCSAKYLFNLPIFQLLHFTAFQVMMIHSFPHLIAGTGTQVGPPPASTGEPGYTCSAKYLFNLPIFQSLHFTAFQVMMIHSFPHLIAGTGTQVGPPPASTGEPGYTCSAKYLFNLPIFQSLHFTAFQVMMIHSFPHLIAGTGTQVGPPPASTGEPGYTCSAKYLFNLPIFLSLYFTAFPHLIAGTGTQVAPPPASTGEPRHTCSAKYLFNLPIFQSLYFTAFQVMMIHSFPHLIAGTGAQVALPPATQRKAAGGKSGKGKCYSLYCSCFLCHADMLQIPPGSTSAPQKNTKAGGRSGKGKCTCTLLGIVYVQLVTMLLYAYQ